MTRLAPELDDRHPELLELAASTAVLVLDVDGVLTDGRLLYSDDGSETKAFHVRDGFGLKQVMRVGIEVAVISGRRSAAVERRLGELGIVQAWLGRDDKLPALQELMGRLGIDDMRRVTCIGDDVPDLPMMESSGLGIAVADAHAEVLQRADWRTRLRGGSGAVREVCDLLARARQETGR